MPIVRIKVCLSFIQCEGGGGKLTFTFDSFPRSHRKQCPKRKWNLIFLHRLHPDLSWGTRGPTVNRAPTRSLRAPLGPSRRKESQQVRTTRSPRTLGSKWQLGEHKRGKAHFPASVFAFLGHRFIIPKLFGNWDCRYSQCRLSFQREKATPWGEDRQHLTEDPPDETETERLGEKPREVAVLETHSAEHRCRGSSGRGPLGVLDVLPVKPTGSTKLTPILHQYLKLGTSLIRISWYVHTWGYLFLKVKMWER